MLRFLSPLTGAAAAIAAVLIAVLIAVAALPNTHAAGPNGVPLPAETGSTWQIAAGYNTGTHSEADNQDPQAIDLIRTDADTTGSAVWSPIDGSVTWIGPECLIIADADGYEHLLCHIHPDPSLSRGDRIAVAQPVATVAASGYGSNGGWPHIHYAVHESRGGGRLGHTLPFTGQYALEGRDLPWRDEWNLYVGEQFTSTNAPDWTAPAAAAVETETSEAAPEPDQSEPVERPQSTAPTDQPDPSPAANAAAQTPPPALRGGWRMVGVDRHTTPRPTLPTLRRRRRPTLPLAPPTPASPKPSDPTSPPPPSSGSARSRPAPPSWAHIRFDRAWDNADWTYEAPDAVEVQLQAGLNLVSWQGPPTSADDALSAIDGVSHAYRWNPRANTYQLWAAGAPEDLFDLNQLTTGDALWLVVDAPTLWRQR